MPIKPPLPGYKRDWVRCNSCASVYHRDYVPYSLSNPVLALPCGHGVGMPLYRASTTITEEEALDEIARKEVEHA